MMDDRAELQLRAEILELRARIDLMASQQQVGGDSVIPSVPRQAGRMTLQTACSWDIVKRDGSAGKIWLRPGKLIHNAGATHTDYTAGGDGTDTAGTGLDLYNGTNWIHAKLTVPTSPALTLDVNTMGRRSDTATARYWPLWIVEYTSASGVIVPLLRMGSQDISATVWQLLTGWDASAKRALDTNTSGVLVWSETGDCEE